MKITNLINKHSHAIVLATLLAAALIMPVQSYAAPIAHIYSSSAASIPAAVWLFGSGLIGMASVSRYKKT
jgi:hypothetical protein